MKKNTKLVLGILGVIILIGLVVAGIYLIPDSTTQASVGSCSGGLTALSISNAYVTTSTDLGGKKVVRVTAVANGGGECLTINWDADLIEGKLGGEYVVDNSVFGSLNTLSQSQTFSVQEQTSDVVERLFRKDIGFWNLCSINSCVDAGYPTTFRAYRPYGLTTCQCLYTSTLGQNGQFVESSSKDFQVEFSIEGAGSTTLTQSKQSGTVGSKAFIKWSGDLMTGHWLGNPNYNAFKSKAESKWWVAEDGYYEDIENRWIRDSDDGLFTDACLRQYSTPSTMDTCINSFNNFVNTKITNKNNDFVNRNSIVDSISWQGNKLIADLETFTTWQMFTIDLDASFVGIHKNVGQPQVQCPTGKPEVIAGSQITSVFKVKDLSDTNPSFGLSLTCNNGGTGSVQQDRINNVGTSYQNINGYVSFEGNTDKDFSCTFEAYDLNSPSNSDECVSNFAGKKYSGCSPEGSKICSSDGERLGICNANGDYVWENCEFGCENLGGSAQCRDTPKEICDDGIDNDGDGKIDSDDPDCQVTECTSCLTWGWDRMFKDETEQCTEATVWKSDTWLGKLFGIEIKQDTWCPVYLIGIGSIILIVLTILLVIIFVGVKISKRGKKHYATNK